MLRLDDVPRPGPSNGEVLVRVRVASVDRGTWHIMAGRPLLARVLGRSVGFGLRRPASRTRAAASPAPLRTSALVSPGCGRATRSTAARHGSFAEYVVAPVELVARKPANLSFAQAATLPISAVAALQAVRDVGGVKAGERVLVIGASGGVGSFAVQVAAAFGVHVTGVSGPGSEPFLPRWALRTSSTTRRRTSPMGSTTTT